MLDNCGKCKTALMIYITDIFSDFIFAKFIIESFCKIFLFSKMGELQKKKKSIFIFSEDKILIFPNTNLLRLLISNLLQTYYKKHC